MYSDDKYISDDNNSDYIDDILCYQELSHSEIIERCDFSNSHISNARLSSDKSILQEEHIMISITETQDSTPNRKDSSNVQRNNNKTYSTMLKLISGALVGGTDYSEIYENCGIDKDTHQLQATTLQITQIRMAAINTIKFQHCRKSQEKLQG